MTLEHLFTWMTKKFTLNWRAFFLQCWMSLFVLTASLWIDTLSNFVCFQHFHHRYKCIAINGDLSPSCTFYHYNACFQIKYVFVLNNNIVNRQMKLAVFISCSSMLDKRIQRFWFCTVETIACVHSMDKCLTDKHGVGRPGIHHNGGCP